MCVPHSLFLSLGWLDLLILDFHQATRHRRLAILHSISAPVSCVAQAVHETHMLPLPFLSITMCHTHGTLSFSFLQLQDLTKPHSISTEHHSSSTPHKPQVSTQSHVSLEYHTNAGHLIISLLLSPCLPKNPELTYSHVEKEKVEFLC